MKPSFKESLAQKITSEDQYKALLNDLHGYDLDYYGAVVMGRVERKLSWWAHREAQRLEYEVYSTSTVLADLNKSSKMYTHISLTDPKRVAYTPDKAFGEQDRQLVISLGKLIARLYPGLRDEEVQEMVQIHESEISDEVEFIQGFEAIDLAYKNMPEGLKACMSKSDDRYGGVSPLKAYDMPNIKLAVIRGHKGNITGRTMVYEASDTDKRFIRTYGDKVTIERRLQKLGYERGTWIGAKFAMVVREDVQERAPKGAMAYVMPYLDGNNSAGGRAVSSVALIAGELTSITESYAKAVDEVQPGSISVCTDTSGYAIVKDFNPDSFLVYDYLTGDKISTLDGPTKIRVGHTFVLTKAEIPLERYIRAKTVVNGEQCLHWMPRSEVWTDNGSRSAAIDKKFLERFGYRMLDEKLYGPERYVDRSYCKDTLDGRVVRSHDTVRVFGDGFADFQYLHTSSIVTKGEGKHIKLGDGVYAMPGTKLYTTPSGRRVHPMVHDVAKRYDGMYDYRRNLRDVKVLGERVYLPKSGGVSADKSTKIYRDIVQKRVEQGMEYLTASATLMRVAEHVYDLSSNGYSSYSGYYQSQSGAAVRISTSGSLPISEQMLNIERLAKAKGNDAAEVTSYVCSIIYAEMQALEDDQLNRDMKRLAARAQQEEAELLEMQQRAVSAMSEHSLITALDCEVDRYQTVHLTVPDWAHNAESRVYRTATGAAHTSTDDTTGLRPNVGSTQSLYELLRSRLDGTTTDTN